MPENEATRHRDGRLRHRAEAGAVQYDPALQLRRCPECNHPAVIDSAHNRCAVCVHAAGLRPTRWTLARTGKT